MNIRFRFIGDFFLFCSTPSYPKNDSMKQLQLVKNVLNAAVVVTKFVETHTHFFKIKNIYFKCIEYFFTFFFYRQILLNLFYELRL